MLLLPDLYQLCGSCYGSHQNVFAAAFPMEKQLILFDTGLDAADLGIIRDNLLLWGLDSFRFPMYSSPIPILIIPEMRAAS